MFIDISPLKASRDFRLLFIGQVVSFFGTMISFVAIQWQVYELTKSSAYVGYISLFQFVPMFVFAFIGGAVADSFDLRRILRLTEIGQTLVTVFLIVNSFIGTPSLTVIYISAAVHAACAALQRPAFESFIQKVIPAELMTSVQALNSLRWSIGAVIGPAIAGVITTTLGVRTAFIVDLATFVVSLIAVYMISAVPTAADAERPSVRGVLDSVRYALSKPYLLGTYIIDIAAMFFAVPQALFPALAKTYGEKFLGLFPAAIATGSLIAALTSGWTKKVEHHGAAITAAAILWGVGIVLFGFANGIWIALACLVFAGFSDMISAIFRGAVWNQSIPNFMRGRLASLEMISYLTGPYLGNAKMGIVAEWTSVPTAIISGGALCIIGVAASAMLIPGFLTYRATDGIRDRELEEARK